MSRVAPGAEFRRLQEIEVKERKSSPERNNRRTDQRTPQQRTSKEAGSSSIPATRASGTRSSSAVKSSAPPPLTRSSSNATRSAYNSPTTASRSNASPRANSNKGASLTNHQPHQSSTDLIILGLRDKSKPSLASDQSQSSKASGSPVASPARGSNKNAARRSNSSTPATSKRTSSTTGGLPRANSQAATTSRGGQQGASTTRGTTASSGRRVTQAAPEQPNQAATTTKSQSTAGTTPAGKKKAVDTTESSAPKPSQSQPQSQPQRLQPKPVATMATPAKDDLARASNMTTDLSDFDTDDSKTVYYGTIDFGGDNRAKFVAPHSSADPGTEEFLFWLLDFWDLKVPKLIISVTGGANDWFMKDHNERLLKGSDLPRHGDVPDPSPETENDRRILESRFKQLFSRGIARAALTANAWIIDGGSNTGVMRLCGMACADTKGLGALGISEQLPTIGIATLKKVHEHEKLLTFGGTVQMREVAGGVRNKCQLDKYHDHFLLVNTPEEGWGLEVKFRTEFEEALCSIVPSVLIVANGGPNTANNVLEAIRQGRPVIVIKGSGRFADDLTELYEKEEDRRANLVLKSLKDKKNDPSYRAGGNRTSKSRAAKRVQAMHRGKGKGKGKGRMAGTSKPTALPPLEAKSSTTGQPRGAGLGIAPHFLSKLSSLLSVGGNDDVVMAAEERHLLEQKDFVEHEDYRFAEIVADGDLHFFDVHEDPLEYMENQIVRSLFKKPSTQDKRTPIDDELLAYAWKRFALYDYNSRRQKALNNWMMYLIITLNVVSTILAVTQTQLVDISRVIAQESTPDSAFRYTIIIIPIIVGVLIGANNRFNPHSKWLVLRGAAEHIKREIYRYRTRTGEYASGHPNLPPRSSSFAAAITEIEKRVADSDVADTALREPDDWMISDIEFDPAVSVYGEHPMDNRYSVQMPEDYFEYRLSHEIEYYRIKAPSLERKLRIYEWVIYILSGGAAVLGALNVEIWIAVTTSLVAAFTTISEVQALQKRLTKYNRAIVELLEVQRWWRGLLDVEKAGPLNVNALIEGTEAILDSEMSSWMQSMREAQAKAKKDLGAATEGGDEEEGEDGKPKKLQASLFTNPKKMKKRISELANRPLPQLNYPLKEGMRQAMDAMQHTARDAAARTARTAVHEALT